MTSDQKWNEIPADGVLNAGPGNSILKGDGFYISYASDTSGNIFSSFGALLGDHADGSETALVKDGLFLILRGDWRKEYEPLASQGYDACIAFFDKHKADHRSKWSDDEPAGARP